MESLAAWLLFALVFYLAACGLGLLAARILRAPLAPGLAAPVGACLGVVVTLPVYKAGGGAGLAAALLALLAAAGLILARRELRTALLPGWVGVTGLLAYGLFIAPVVLSGHWTWMGYNFVNDTAVNMVMVDHVAANGVRPYDGPPSTTGSLIDGTLGSRYPMGLHGFLAALHALVGFLPLEAVYQPFIAGLAALAAMALARLATALGVVGIAAAAIGVLSVGANLTYQYAGHGAFKEIAMVLVVAAAAALCREAADRRLQLGTVALLGGVCAAGILIFSTAAVPYVGLFAVGLLVAVLLPASRPRPVVVARAAGVGVLALVVAALPGLLDALAFGRSAAEFYRAEGGLSGPNSTAFLGHLLRPLPLHEAVGIWPGPDYRVPLPGVRGAAVIAATVLSVGLGLFALASELRARRLGVALLIGPCLVTYLVAMTRLGPYAEAKLLVLLAPAVVFTAGIGAWVLSRRFAPAGLLAGGALALGILYSDALAYHSNRLAPVDRLQALQATIERVPKDELVLLPEWEEWGKYFGRHRSINVGPESYSPRPVDLIEYFSYFGHSVDLDQLKAPYVQSFDWLLIRRSPADSRPPSNYRLVHADSWYELWKRDPGLPAAQEHLSLSFPHQPGRVAPCASVKRLAGAAGRGDKLLAAPPGLIPAFDYTAKPPLGWNPAGPPGTVVPGRPGDPEGKLKIDAGRYRIWVRGSSGRELKVFLDGRSVGQARGVNNPEQWLPLPADVSVRGGRHEVRLLRPGGDLLPGDGFAGELGPVAFEPVEGRALVEVAPAQAERKLCGKAWDWVERVGGKRQ
ncbi:MAG: hypothetical protein M3P40_11460 [Actinomycetota bacterium]|nr:hypothetical protein [Actinomycetota bacterium]